MGNLSAQENSLREKLASEYRRCPECTLEITNPFIERCPRCYAKVARASTDCQGCFHKTICPVKPPES
jgi:hypothetical protein